MRQKKINGAKIMQHHELAQRVRDALAACQGRVVLAESCTAGNVAGTLAVVPGISAWLCGSFVVYRNDSKTQWLNIPRALLDDPHIGPVSAQVTRLLAAQALQATPEANMAAAVTGHIGPGCPPELDGQVFFCLIKRSNDQVIERSLSLTSPAPHDEHDLARRADRLEEATVWVLESIASSLESQSDVM